MNIVIPMAGAGSRFSNAGYQHPKPFIPVQGKAMIEHVISNITSPNDKIYLLAKLDHLHYLNDTSIMDNKNVSIIPVLHKTEGALCTVLLAEKFIDTTEGLIIANSDQYVEYDKWVWRRACDNSDVDGLIMTFPSTESKWSYAKTEESRVIEVAEKNPISEHATVGVYYFKHGFEFVRSAKKMIKEDFRVNGEFYVCPVYNWYIKDNPATHIFDIDSMYGMGTPEDLEKNYEFIGK